MVLNANGRLQASFVYLVVLRLCAVVAEDRLPTFAANVNAFPSVIHDCLLAMSQ